MELQQLRYFQEVAHSEHITRSAERLHIAQPALTQSLHRLEHELGVPLIEHVGRNIRLTPAGVYLAQRLEPLLVELEALPADVVGYEREEERTVSIDLQAASSVVIDAIAAYRVRYPTARFAITQNATDSRADIRVDTLLPTEMTPSSRDVARHASQRRFRERILLAVPDAASYPAEGISLRMLADRRFISLSDSRRFREICDALCRTRGFTPDVTFESDNPSVVKKMIALGLGVGFWPQHSWGAFEDDDVHLVPLLEEGFERDIRISRMDGEQAHTEVARFHGYLLEYLEGVWGDQENR